MSADIQGVCQSGLFADRVTRVWVGGLIHRLRRPIAGHHS